MWYSHIKMTSDAERRISACFLATTRYKTCAKMIEGNQTRIVACNIETSTAVGAVYERAYSVDSRKNARS